MKKKKNSNKILLILLVASILVCNISLLFVESPNNSFKEADPSSTSVNIENPSIQAIPLLNNYPVILSDNALGILTADLENNGKSEILVSLDTAGTLDIYNYGGTSISNWPKTIGSNQFYGRPAAADLNNDGIYEIIGGGTRLQDNFYVYSLGGSAYSGWPVFIDNGMGSSPVLGDVNNDGELEIIANAYETDKVYAWYKNGTILENWPKSVGTGPLNGRSTPAIADFDSDGDLEIIVGSADHKLYGWYYNGTNLPGFPVTLDDDMRENSAIIGDVNNDNRLEIVIMTFSSLYIIWDDGTILYQRDYSASSSQGTPALADLDGDNDLEIAFRLDNGSTYIMHHTGSLMTGWPKTLGNGYSYYSTPLFADVNGDKNIDLVINLGGEGEVYAYDYDGTLLTDYPLSTTDRAIDLAINDIDGDGFLEIVCADETGNRIYAWKTTGEFNHTLMPWPMFQHDIQHTGTYNFTFEKKFQPSTIIGGLSGGGGGGGGGGTSDDYNFLILAIVGGLVIGGVAVAAGVLYSKRKSETEKPEKPKKLKKPEKPKKPKEKLLNLCPNCQSKIPPDEDFCPYCGIKAEPVEEKSKPYKDKKVKNLKTIDKKKSLAQLKEKLDIFDTIKLSTMREILNMDEDTFNEKIIDWAIDFGFKIDGASVKITNEALNKFIREVNHQFKDS